VVVVQVRHGVCFAPQQRERGIRRHRYDTIAEGIGLDRLTANFHRALVDDAVRVSDQEALCMAHFLLRHEGETSPHPVTDAWVCVLTRCATLVWAAGLFVGSSTAVNLVAAVVAARRMGPGHVVVTVLCDGGHRHMTRSDTFPREVKMAVLLGFGITPTDVVLCLAGSGTASMWRRHMVLCGPRSRQTV
jgi:cysteine synthase A